MEIFRLLLLCTFCFVPIVTYSVEGTNEKNSYEIQEPEEPETIPSWKIIEAADDEEGTVDEDTGDSELKCSSPPAQTCGHYEGTNYDMGATITLICNPGCELVGQSDLHCVGIPNPFRHMVMWDSFTGITPSCRQINQRTQRSINKEDEKKNETPVEYTVEIIEKEPTPPPYLESTGAPKTLKDEYGKTSETEHGNGKHSVDCSADVLTGPCRGSFPRFYYDTKTDSCQYFIYGGCHGNSNNFKTKESCEKACVKSS